MLRSTGKIWARQWRGGKSCYSKNYISKDKKLLAFENGYHELHNDEEFIELRESVVKWCNERVAKAKILVWIILFLIFFFYTRIWKIDNGIYY